MRLAITILFAALGFAQTQPVIEAATVKANRGASLTIDFDRDPTRVWFMNMNARQMVHWAYDVPMFMVAGGPAWMERDRWNVEMKNDIPSTEAQQRALLQTLFAERFKLRVHWESREIPKLRMVAVKSGKLRGADSAVERSVRWGHGSMEAHSITIAMLAEYLQNELDMQIEDATGLSGKYDFKLEWARDPGAADATAPSLFTAIQEFGLKLESIKGPVRVLVIDSGEKPVIE
jgi:uncharacterized protein (TIGR03435 family)